MKFSIPIAAAILSSLASTSLAATITRYHTHTHTVVHTHTLTSTHYKTITGDNNEVTTSASTETKTSTGTKAAETTAAADTTSTTAAVVTTAAEETTSTSSTSTAAAETTTSATSTSATSSPTSTFASEILAEHNKKRALHGVPDLSWSSTLEEYAQNYANEYDCSSGSLVHSGGSYGENLALGYDTIAAVDAWYDEISLYNYDDPGFSEATGHFTQVVWKSSTELGCAAVQCGSYYGQYTICSYSPAGNVIGYFEENVLPLV